MISRYTYKELVWVDLESPTQDEVRGIMEEFSVHPLAAEELLAPTLRPKVDLYPNFIYLILHFPSISHKHNGGFEQEIDFIVGKNFIITTHYDLIDSLHEFSKVFEVNSILEKSNIGDHAGFILFYILKELYKTLGNELNHIERDFAEIEPSIFGGKERDMVTAISHINRDLLNFKQIIRPHKEVLDSLELSGTKFFGVDFSYYLRTITGEYFKVSSILDGHRETLLELRNTNDSLLTTKTNDIMKTIAIISFVTFPLSLIATIFGMNASHIPIVGRAGDFWFIIGIMATITLTIFAYFKRKRWI